MSWLLHPEARRFQDCVAIVTGAGRGIGREYAMSLAREGAKVCIAEINRDNAEKTAAEINELGGVAIAVETDVSQEQSTLNLVKETADKLGGIDYLVNNAALYGDRIGWDVMTGPIDYWNVSLAVNLTSVVLCTRAAAPYMIERGGGAIVNQSSDAAFQFGGGGRQAQPAAQPPADPSVGAGGGVQYSVTKMGVISLTYAFAKLLGKHNIRVNAIAPGLTDTEAYQKQVVSRGAEPALIESLAIQRRGTPQDQAGGVLYLLSDAASYVTGQTLSVDGGMVMRF